MIVKPSTPSPLESQNRRRAPASVVAALKQWEKVERIYERQATQRWGAEYDPAIHAVAGEAPPTATPVAFWARRLGRTMHAMSHPEAYFMAVAMMNPAVWEIHEQAIMHPYAAQHPLAQHPVHGLRPWPATQGTLKILHSWGLFARHPRVSRPDGEDGNEHRPMPWIGDIRLFLSDESGPYLVDWDVKDRTGAHGRPYCGYTKAVYSPREQRKAELRERAYQAYNAELGIPTRRVATDQISEPALRNMLRILMRVQAPLRMPESLVAEVEHALIEAVIKGDTPAMAVRKVVREERAAISAQRVLEWAIWQRKLRVSFEHDILPDRPLVPAAADPVDLHAHLFRR